MPRHPLISRSLRWWLMVFQSLHMNVILQTTVAALKAWQSWCHENPRRVDRLEIQMASNHLSNFGTMQVLLVRRSLWVADAAIPIKRCSYKARHAQIQSDPRYSFVVIISDLKSCGMQHSRSLRKEEGSTQLFWGDLATNTPTLKNTHGLYCIDYTWLGDFGLLYIDLCD